MKIDVNGLIRNLEVHMRFIVDPKFVPDFTFTRS